MKKALIAIGATGLVILVGVAIHRGVKAQRASKKALAQLGAATSGMREAATAQVKLAEAGMALKGGYRQAEGLTKFWNPPETREEAFLKAAYWTAVASRIVQSPALAQQARAFLANTKSVSKFSTSGLSEIMQSAANAVSPHVGTNADVKGILAILGQQASSDALAARKAQINQASPSGLIVSQGKEAFQTGLDTANAAIAYAKGIVTGAPPPGVGPVAWFFQKWGLRLGIGLGGYLILRAWLAPEIAAVKKLATSAGGTIGAVRAALPAPAEKAP